jgi:hypothetical protein
MESMDRFRGNAGLAWILGGLAAMLVWSGTRPDPGAGAVTWVVSGVAALLPPSSLRPLS